jgi:hypothetical protein
VRRPGEQCFQNRGCLRLHRVATIIGEECHGPIALWLNRHQGIELAVATGMGWGQRYNELYVNNLSSARHADTQFILAEPRFVVTPWGQSLIGKLSATELTMVK